MLDNLLFILFKGGIVEYKYYPDPRSVLFGLQPITNPYYTPDLGPDDYLGNY